MNGGTQVIDLSELRHLCAAGLSQARIAWHVGVSQQAISQAIRKHNVRPIKQRHGDRPRKDRHP